MHHWHTREEKRRTTKPRYRSVDLLVVVVGDVEIGGAAGCVGVFGAAAVVELGGVGRVVVAKLVVPAMQCNASSKINSRESRLI